MSADAVAKLIDRLSTDDAFREHMLGDPHTALKSMGLHVDASTIPSVRKLPSKQTLAASKDQLNAQIGGNAGLSFLLLK